jgi:hypothetical protein
VQLHTGERFIIINVFPSFSDRHVWWHIQVEASGLEGWIMENHTWFEPVP